MKIVKQLYSQLTQQFCNLIINQLNILTNLVHNTNKIKKIEPLNHKHLALKILFDCCRYRGWVGSKSLNWY